MAITPLPTAPNSGQDAQTFNANADGMFAALPAFVSDVNTTQAAMSMIAAGTAFAIPYTFDTTITDADPGAGKLRLSSATQNAATVIRADLFGADLQDYTAVLGDFTSSTNTVKGQIRLVKLSDATKWLTFNLTATATPTGYRNLTVTPVAGSSATPFVNNDSVVMLFTRSGDLGVTYPVLHVREQQTSGTNAGTSAANGTQTRVFNTIVVNTIAGASLASNTVTLPAGTYQVLARIPSYGAVSNSANLFNSSDSTVTLISGSSSQGSTASDNIFIMGFFTIAATKNFTIVQWTLSSQVNFGLGAAGSLPGQLEVYSDAIYMKIG